MSDSPVRRLDDLRATDGDEVGGKAASLGQLIADGARVPDGFVLTAHAASASADERRRLILEQPGVAADGRHAVRSSGVGEDGSTHSYAGLFDTVLDVATADVPAAVERCLASAGSDRVTAYVPAADIRMAVIVQRMIRPVAAGVALTADPITGERASTIVTAVRGTGDQLVSGEAVGDEWVVRGDRAEPRRRPETAIDASQVRLVAAEARRIADRRGTPQDIEWAIDGEGVLWILQARPMTALPPQVSWVPPAPGAFTRQLRMGEWIGEPVTPLFESWLLTAMEDRMHGWFFEQLGQRAPRPFHVVVNGWYFYSLNWASPGSMARNLPRLLWHVLRTPRRVAGIAPATVRHSFPIMEREWRADIQPRYRAAVERADERVERVPVAELPALIDELAELAGEAFAALAALAGAAYKMEINLAGFYHRHLRPSLGGSHLPLLTGIEAPTARAAHAVTTLDWWRPTAGPSGAPGPAAADHAPLVEARRAAEDAAFAALASNPRRLAAFRRVLADAQHLVPVREEQVSELTIAWPVMRRAVLRIGAALAERHVIPEPDDVFFLTRAELLDALAGDPAARTGDVAERRAQRDEQARLVPPLLVGRLNPLLKRMIDAFPRLLGATPSSTALVSGSPASPGRVTGPVRVIRGPDDFDQLVSGEILVAPMTAPAWTPLFTRAVAVVTDVGSAAAHASIIAREYGIPAVVGCGDATARLRTGMVVTVDGSTGNVEAA